MSLSGRDPDPAYPRGMCEDNPAVMGEVLEGEGGAQRAPNPGNAGRARSVLLLLRLLFHVRINKSTAVLKAQS